MLETTQKGIRQIMDIITEMIKMARKRMCEHFLCNSDKKLVDNEQSYQ
jgi:hypothetical protein